MNELSNIAGNGIDPLCQQQAIKPVSNPASGEAVALFRDLMRTKEISGGRESPGAELGRPPTPDEHAGLVNTEARAKQLPAASSGNAGEFRTPHALDGLSKNAGRNEASADIPDLAIDEANSASQRAPANARPSTVEGERETPAPFNIPAELMAGGLHRNSGNHAPATVPGGIASAMADAAQADEVASLLQSFCSNLYVADIQKPGTGHIMVDLGAALPGSSVEMTRDGVFLNVRLHAADETMMRLMRGGSDRLLDALNKSTGLVVRLDLVQRTGTTGRES